MNPADVSYRTSRLIGYLPIAPDNMVRDHRKIAFFDLTEIDPGKGEALFGGVGVGEQYATATWEDRAVRRTGPAALTLKDAARRYLKANGLTDANIPFPLQPLPKPADYDERVKALEARGWTATAMQVHNDRGFARKDASIASAVLYTPYPPFPKGGRRGDFERGAGKIRRAEEIIHGSQEERKATHLFRHHCRRHLGL